LLELELSLKLLIEVMKIDKSRIKRIGKDVYVFKISLLSFVILSDVKI